MGISFYPYEEDKKPCKKEKELNNQPQSLNLEQLEYIQMQMKKSICKIKCKDKGFGTRFFCRIPFPDYFNLLPVLITNYHVIKSEDIQPNKAINISINNENLNITLIIDKSRKIYANKEPYDITIIELRKRDGINLNSFLDIDNEFIANENYIQKSIYLIHYPHGLNVEFSSGVIQSIGSDNYTIFHLCSTKAGSSGAPIFNLFNYKILGIHIGSTIYENYNFGTLIKIPIKEFINKNINKNMNKNINISKIEDNNNIIETNELLTNDNFDRNTNKIYAKDYIIQSLNSFEDNKLDKLDKKQINIKLNNINPININNFNEVIKKYPYINDGIKVEKRKPCEYENSVIYDGEWDIKRNVLHGRGIQLWPDGTKYIGYFKNNKVYKKGIIYFSNGSIYEGELLNCKFNGYSKYINVDGTKYEGEWKDDKENGYGKEFWTDGAKYEGQYKNGEKSGKGIFIWPDGSIYEGSFENNLLNGEGAYFFSDKRKYIGTWVNNFKEGKGVFIWPDGRKYFGEYKNDKKNGYGIFEWTNGKKYKVYWKNGKPDGKGEFFILSENKWKKGIWKDGKRIQ